MSEIVVEFKSVESTQLYANQMAFNTLPGTLIAMFGGLGSGKTTFTQGFAKGLGVKSMVGSPTFKIISEYDGSSFKLYHIDCYRLDNEQDFLIIGGENYLEPIDGVTIIEWSEKIPSLIPDHSIRIHFERIKNNTDSRRIRIVRPD